jgi:hypothetical protein
MHFQTEEYYHKYSPWLKVWEVVRGYLMLFYLPIAFGKHLLEKMHGVVEPEIRQCGVWLEHAEYNDLLIWSLALKEEEHNNLIKSDVFDFPHWEDWEDPFRSILKIRTEPTLNDVEDMFFHAVELQTEDGLYLIRINEKGKGMTFCYLSAADMNLYEVINLKPLSWIIDLIDENTLSLTGYADKGKYVIKVKTGHTNRINQTPR